MSAKENGGRTEGLLVSSLDAVVYAHGCPSKPTLIRPVLHLYLIQCLVRRSDASAAGAKRLSSQSHWADRNVQLYSSAKR